jgi:hypothetical protein
MSQPQDIETFEQRFNESQAMLCCDLTRGLGMPCPFCASPNFTKYPVFEVEDHLHITQTCEECGRSGRFTFERFLLCGTPAQKFFILQTSGPPQPDWFMPRIGWVQ